MPRLLHEHPNDPIFLPWRHNIKIKDTLRKVQGNSLPTTHTLQINFHLQGRQILRPSSNFWATPSYHNTKQFHAKIMFRECQVDTMPLSFLISPTIRLLSDIWRKAKKSFLMCCQKWTPTKRKQRELRANAQLLIRVRLFLRTLMQPPVRPYQ